MEENATFVDEQIRKLQTSADEGKSEVSECRKQTLYLETYSRRENLKFEGIPELSESPGQQNISSNEDTKNVLVNFMKDVLEIEDADDNEISEGA